MEIHSDIDQRDLRSRIRRGEIVFGGNKLLRIYGHLNCFSGKRMKPGNRVFFRSEAEALHHNYRPCGHCMKEKYAIWKTTRSR